MAHFSSRLLARRNRLGLSQSALAKAAGVSEGSISAWERGLNQPTGRMLECVAEALNVSPAWLLGGSHDDEVARNAMRDSVPAYFPRMDLRIQDLINRLNGFPVDIREKAFFKIDEVLRDLLALYSPPPFPTDQPDAAVMAAAEKLQPIAIQEAIDRAQAEQPTLDRAELSGGAGRYPAPRRQRQGGGP